MTRLLDIVLAGFGLAILTPLMILFALIGALVQGQPMFRQLRVGRNQVPFVLFKFRTMRLDAPQVATHLVSADAITPWGHFLRRTKLDELPQLWNVLRGDMSLVGPRPCLFSQVELIQARADRGVLDYRPGITGLAQVRGVDMSDPTRLADLDAEMLSTLNAASYCRYVVLTVIGRGSGDRVRR